MKKWLLGGLLGLVVLGLAGLWSISTKDLPHEVLQQRYGQAPSKFMRWSDGTRIHYRDQGPKDAATIVLLHGSNASLHTWEGWVKALVPKYRVVTLDLPGHGLTGGVPDGKYGYEAMLRFVKRFVDTLGLKSFVLGGNSMGGALSWKYTLRHPDQVKQLILVDAAGVPRKKAGRLPLAFRLARIPVLNKLILNVTPRSLVAEGLARSYGDPSKVKKETVTLYHQLALHQGNRAATVARFSGYRVDKEIPPLAKIKAPTLILWGQKDVVTPIDMSDIYLKHIKGSKRVIYPSLGHIPMEEDPQATVKDVLLFLQANAAPPAPRPAMPSPNKPATPSPQPSAPQK